MLPATVKTLAIYSIKGGVGKTATAVNLAYLAAQAGQRVLLWDLDPQGAASFYLRVKPRIKGGIEKVLRSGPKLDRRIRGTDYEGLDLLPADFSYRHLDLALEEEKKPHKRLRKVIEAVGQGYDWVLLDCAPSISLASESVFTAAEALLVPVIPTPLSLRTLEQLEGHLREQGPKRLAVLPFLCLVDSRKKLHREGWAELARGGFERFLDTQIPYSTWVEQMGLQRAPLNAFAANSPPAQAYAELWDEVQQALGNL